ncbi:hypothetical protein Bca4012_026607 [Brassica carinata]
MSSWSSRTIYVVNLPGDIREREVEDLFSKYGPVVQIDLKIPPRPPGYAFVEFEDPRDAEDAIHGRDGYDFDGHCLRVELAHGGRRSSNDARGGASRGGRDGGDRGRGPSRRSEYRVLVSGLPSSASWQDLKDHMRKGGEVCFSQVYRDGRGTTGIVDYTSYEDMKYAIKKLDDTEFRNAFSRGYVRVREYDSRSPSRGRSYSKSRSRSLVAAAEAGAGVQTLNLRVDRLQNQHRDLLAPALSQGHHLREEGMFHFLMRRDTGSHCYSVIDMDPSIAELGTDIFIICKIRQAFLRPHGTDAVLMELDVHLCPWASRLMVKQLLYTQKTYWDFKTGFCFSDFCRSRSRSRSPLPSVLKEASKSPSKLSPAKSPMHSRSKNRSRSPSR